MQVLHRDTAADPVASRSSVLSIVCTSELTGASVGMDRFGFHVIVDGALVFGPLASRSTAVEIADSWGRPRAAI